MNENLTVKQGIECDGWGASAETLKKRRIRSAHRMSVPVDSRVRPELFKQGLVVDPDRIVIRPDRGFDDVVFSTVEEALVTAERVLRANPIR